MVAKLVLETESGVEERRVAFDSHPWEMCPKLNKLNKVCLVDVFSQKSEIVDLFLTTTKIKNIIQKNPEFLSKLDRWTYQSENAFVLFEKKGDLKFDEVKRGLKMFVYRFGVNEKWYFKESHKNEWFPMKEFIQIRKAVKFVNDGLIYLNTYRNILGEDSLFFKKTNLKIKNQSIKALKLVNKLNQSIIEENFNLLFIDTNALNVMVDYYDDYLKEKKYEKIKRKCVVKDNGFSRGKI